MKKCYLLGLLMFFGSFSASAESLTIEQAKEKAAKFLRVQGMDGALRSVEPQASQARATQKGELPCYYMFNVGQGDGFVIMAGDDLAPSVLGYSDRGEISADRLPPNMQAWLESCEEQIRYMRANNVSAVRAQVARQKVDALIETQWNQFNPYNLFLPTYVTKDSKGRTVTEKCATGCVATAMAQVMYYYKYPSATKSPIPGYTFRQPSSGQNKTLSGVSAGSVINWGNMLKKYTGNESASAREAVAMLMDYCGRSVKMTYDQSSSATVKLIADAMKTYFGYSKNVTYKYYNDDGYTYTQWDNMIYYELLAKRPVILSGHISSSPSSGGHAFICDGCDTQGKYHINWGWGGDGDGYYALNMLEPTTTGYNWGPLKYHWEAIIGLEKDEDAPEEQVYLTATDFTLSTSLREFTATTVNGVQSYGPLGFTISFANNMKNAYKFELNIAVYHDNVFKEYLFDETQVSLLNTTPEIPSKATGKWNSDRAIYLPGNTRLLCFSQPGTYRLVVVSRKSGTKTWFTCPGYTEHYITGTVGADAVLRLKVIGESSVNPGEGITADELKELSNELLEQRDIVEQRRKYLLDFRDSLNKYAQKMEELRTAYQELRDKCLELKRKAELLGSNVGNGLDQLVTMYDSYVDQEFGAIETFWNTASSDCDTYLNDLAQLKNKMAQQERDLVTLVTKADYDQLRASVTANALLLPSIDALQKTENDCENVRVKLDATYKSLFGSGGAEQAYQTFEDRLRKAIEKNDQMQQREQTIIETEERLNTLRTDYNSLEEKLWNAYYRETTLLQLIGVHEYNLTQLNNLIEQVLQQLQETDLTDEQRLSLQQDYEQLKAKNDSLAAVIGGAKELAETPTVADEEMEALGQSLNQLINDFNEAASMDAILAVGQGIDEMAARLAPLSEAGEARNVKLQELTDDSDKWNAAVKSVEEDAQQLLANISEAAKLAAEELLRQKQELLKSADEMNGLLNEMAADAGVLKVKVLAVDNLLSKMDAYHATFDQTRNEVQQLLDSKALTDEEYQSFTKREAELSGNILALLDEVGSQSVDYLFDPVLQGLQTRLNDLIQHISSIGKLADVPEVRKESEELLADMNSIPEQLSKKQESTDSFLNVLNDGLVNMEKWLAQYTLLKNELEGVVTRIPTMIVDGKRVVGCYDVKGRAASPHQKGLVILRLSDGSTKKVYNK